jgi:PTH1 family peptidyl-tRNA hydrolase
MLMVNRLGPADTTESKLLIVGLGNPGPDYAEHRHNIGFRVVDALARAHGLSFSRCKPARAYLARGQVCGRTVLLAKPRTFMNLSGRAVSRLSRADDIPPGRVLVVYDDLDLPLGRLRLREDGGSGGHRGMRSIIDRLGTQGFPRLRIGIDRPPGRIDPAEYVLQPFEPEQETLLLEVVGTAVEAIECWLGQGIVVAMERFNRPPSVEPAALESDRPPGTALMVSAPIDSPDGPRQTPAEPASRNESSSAGCKAEDTSRVGTVRDKGSTGEELE